MVGFGHLNILKVHESNTVVGGFYLISGASAAQLVITAAVVLRLSVALEPTTSLVGAPVFPSFGLKTLVLVSLSIHGVTVGFDIRVYLVSCPSSSFDCYKQNHH